VKAIETNYDFCILKSVVQENMSGVEDPSNNAMDLLWAENRRMRENNRKTWRKMVKMREAIKDLRKNKAQQESASHEDSESEEEVKDSRNEQVKDSGSEHRSLMKQFREYDPPSFDGTKDPEIAEGWI